jgi:hypothetical protein
MPRNCVLICLFFALAPAALHAQGLSDVHGWEVVPDSLFLIWHLDQDQIKRLRVIETDYDTERQHVAVNTKADAAAKDARLRKLGKARLNEIKGVLGTEYFSDWRKRMNAVPTTSP